MGDFSHSDLREIRDVILARIKGMREGEADRDLRSLSFFVQGVFHVRLSGENRRDGVGGEE